MTTAARAVLLDFDGLILETEGCSFASWRVLFQERGAAYALEEYQQIVGTVGTPRELFEARCGAPADWTALETRRRAIEDRLHLELRPQPGVEALLEQARTSGLGIAVASSSTHGWVDRLLEGHGLLHRFDAIVCREDVGGRAKPAPDLYLEALRRLGVAPAAAIAFEDSTTGALAARRAGIRCVAVPTAITRTQDFSHADLIVPSLDGIDLRALLGALLDGGR